MAGNSFVLKGWAVTLVAGIYVLASKDADKIYYLITYVPIVIFGDLMHIISGKNACTENSTTKYASKIIMKSIFQ